MATTPILSLPVAIGVDNTYWVPTASTNGSPTERVNVQTLTGIQGTLDSITNVQGSILFRGAEKWVGLAPGTLGYVLATQGPGADPTWAPGTAGSVTSVGLSLPESLFSISGSPVTSSGTLAGNLIAQSANKVFAGPSTGSDATPTFRELVAADIPGAANTALSNLSDVAINTTLKPGTNDGAALGSGSLSFSDLFLASGGVINWGNSNVALTHSSGLLSTNASLTIANAVPVITITDTDTNATHQISGNSGVAALFINGDTTNVNPNSAIFFQMGGSQKYRMERTAFIPATSDGAALGSTSNMWSDLLLASGGVINWNNGTYTATQSASNLAFSGSISLGTALAVTSGGTGLTSGASGGILGFTASGTLASSVALTSNALVRGQGAGNTPVPSAVFEDGSGNITGVTTINGSSPHARLRTINPMGQYSQAGLASTSNGNYTGFDQWYALTQSNPITPSQLTSVENGTPYMMRFTQDNASAQRYGVAQPLEFSFVNDLRGKSVSLSARVRMSTATTLRYAIVEWTGTADGPTKNIVNNWSSTTYTPGNFFISSNTTITATGSTALASNTLTTITLSGAVSSSMNNLIVFFWTDSTQAQNVTLDISNVWFGEGTAPSIFEPIAPDDDFRKCLRYFQSITPGTTLPVGFGYVPGGTSPRIMVPITTAMRATPSASLVGGTGITGTQCLTYSGGGGTSPTAMSVNSADSSHVWFVLTVTGMASGSLTNWAWSGGTAGSLVLDARL